jgi:hypothetical protein
MRRTNSHHLSALRGIYRAQRVETWPREVSWHGFIHTWSFLKGPKLDIASLAWYYCIFLGIKQRTPSWDLTWIWQFLRASRSRHSFWYIASLCRPQFTEHSAKTQGAQKKTLGCRRSARVWTSHVGLPAIENDTFAALHHSRKPWPMTSSVGGGNFRLFRRLNLKHGRWPKMAGRTTEFVTKGYERGLWGTNMYNMFGIN